MIIIILKLAKNESFGTILKKLMFTDVLHILQKTCVKCFDIFICD